jgi:hypothetical protein
MGLKGYRLWVMGQLDSTCSAPPRHLANRDELLRVTYMYTGHYGKRGEDFFVIQGVRFW